MWLDGVHASTSITTIVLEPSEDGDGPGTRLTFTEQGVHVDGVHGPDDTLLSELDAGTAERYIATGVIEGGMIPKVRAAIRGLAGASAAHIIDGRVPHSLLLELLTERGVGTMLRHPETTSVHPTS